MPTPAEPVAPLAATESEGPATPRRPIWRRRWVLAGVGVFVLVGLLIGVAGSTWADRFGAPPPAQTMTMPANMLPRLPFGLSKGKSRPPAEKEETLDLMALPPSRPMPVGSPGSPELAFAGQIAPCLAVANDPARGLLLASSADGMLRWYETKSFRQVGACRLHKGAYHLAFDAAHRRLYTAGATPQQLHVSPLGDCEHAVGDIHAYDLASVLEGGRETATHIPLQPIQTHPLSAHVTALILSPDDGRLRYLAETPRHVHVGCLVISSSADSATGKDAAGTVAPVSMKREQSAWLRVGGSSMLARAPDEGPLYALSGGRVEILDAQTLKVAGRFRVGATVLSISAGRQGRLYLLERRFGLFVHVLDVPTMKVLGRWAVTMEGRVSIQPSLDGRYLYVGSSAVYRGCIRALDAGSESLEEPVLRARVVSDRERLLRGPLLLSPDGRYVIMGSGYVFQALS